MKISEMTDSERLEEGYYLAKIVITVLGKPKEHVVEMRDKILEAIKNSKELFIAEEFIADPKEDEDMFSTFMELDIWFKTLKEIFDFSMAYLPSHIEIIKPDNVKFSAAGMSELANDLVLRLHSVDKVYKETQFKFEGMNRAITKLINNGAKLALSKKPSTAKEIGEVLGLKEEDLLKFIKPSLDKGEIIQEGDIYKLGNPDNKIEEKKEDKKEDESGKKE